MNVKVRDNFTALIWATHKRRPEIAKALIMADADLNQKIDFGDTALIWQLAMMTIKSKILIGAGVDLNTKNENDDTPLLRSVDPRHADSALPLIRAGAEVNTKSFGGETA